MAVTVLKKTLFLNILIVRNFTNITNFEIV
jgi:hypothetical protein